MFISTSRTLRGIILAALAVFFVVPTIFFAQQIDQSLYQSMKWRMIGPFRAGRTVGAVGIPSQPNVFYIGVNNGGVWKTTDAGRTWKPIFDDQPTGSIGDIAIAPSNPNVIYVGSGEGLQRPDLSTGDGMYKSTDAGQTWQHLALREGQQIASIAVDPKNEDRGSEALGSGNPTANAKTEAVPPGPAPTPPSKQQLLAALVVRDEGATLDQMIAATGWLPHTTRAALTGLKKKGYVVSSDKVDGVRTYRAVAPE